MIIQKNTLSTAFITCGLSFETNILLQYRRFVIFIWLEKTIFFIVLPLSQQFREFLSYVIVLATTNVRENPNDFFPFMQFINLTRFFNLFQNPQFSNTSTYVIYAHLLRQIAALTEADHHFLVHWSKK